AVGMEEHVASITEADTDAASEAKTSDEAIAQTQLDRDDSSHAAASPDSASEESIAPAVASTSIEAAMGLAPEPARQERPVTEDAPAEDALTTSDAESSEPQSIDETETQPELQPEQATAGLSVEAEAANAPGDGVNEEGRAVNDPRVAPAPVQELHIETGQIVLFSETPAPAVAAPDRQVPRASNDPRGPKGARSAEG
ncbi:MAG: ribonuclease E/G, partial [Congregibacter sp.]